MERMWSERNNVCVNEDEKAQVLRRWLKGCSWESIKISGHVTSLKKAL